MRQHVRLCEAECTLAWLFTSSTVAAGLTTLVEWIQLATCVSARFIYFNFYYPFSKLILKGSWL